MMPVGREFTVLELDGSRLSAVTAILSGGRVEVTRWLAAVRPDTVSGDNARAVGEWIGQEFKRAGLPKGRAVLAVSRGDIVLKHLSLPIGPETSDADMAGMVRLQMVRQLTMSLEGTAIDYAPMKAIASGEAAPAGPTRQVLAGAMPADRVAWYRELADHAGLKLRRIGLRCFGASALLADLSQRKDGPVLGVAIGSGSSEFVVVEDGEMMFARAADTPKPTTRADIEGFAEKIAVEAKRTWMSYRSSRGSQDVEIVAVLGEGDLVAAVGEKCGAALGQPWETVRIPAIVDLPAHMPESERATAAPLVGLLVEAAIGRPTLDFANPRKLPDLVAKRRQYALAAALGLIVLGGVGYVAADQRLSGMRAELAGLREREADLRREVDEYLVEHARVSHLEQWRAARIDWLAHVARLSEELPDSSDALLDELTGRMGASAAYSSLAKPYPQGTWSVRQQAVFDLNGRVDDRQITNDLRERLLASGVYRVESRGADVPDRFSLELITAATTPAAEPAREATVPARKAEGGTP